MQLRSYALAGAVLAAATATATAFAADGTFDRTLTVSGPATLNISTGSGYLHIYAGADNQMHIVGHVHSHPGLFGSNSDDEVKQIVKEPPIRQSGSTVTVQLPHDSELYRNISIDYDVTAPANSTLKAGTGSGSIEIGGIQGEVTATSGSGSIRADNIGGNARLQTGSGSIDATNVKGGATLGTGSGKINFVSTAPGSVTARTGSGGIRLAGVSGLLRADTGSGAIDLAGNPTAEWRARTGSGGIHVQLPPQARVDLHADAGSGGVHIDRPMAVVSNEGRHHLAGTINGGGPTIRLSSGSGGITVE